MKKDILFAILFSLLMLPLLNQYATQNQAQAVQKPAFEEPQKTAVKRKFGIAVDSFHIFSRRVQRNEYLSTIFDKLDIPYEELLQVTHTPDSIFDIRKIRAGRPYHVFYSSDSLKTPLYWVYEKTPMQYVRITLGDNVKVEQGQRKSTLKKQTAEGVIESSLWNTLKNNELPFELSIELSDMYAWTIDFFSLQKGDRFKVVYEEEFVDSVHVGISSVQAAQFIHGDTSYMAFHFTSDSVSGYYDQHGNSLEKEFLKAPLHFTRVSSGFTYRRMHPILKRVTTHLGVDYAAPRGTPVMSIGEGKVIAKYTSRGGGNVVKIKHNGVYTTAYLHLMGFEPGLHVGKHVEQGERIGRVGSTGWSTGPHLDFRVWRNGQNMDPTKLKSPPVEPVPPYDEAAFATRRDSLQQALRKIGRPLM